MADHPIQGLMQTAMENIKEMVDVNTIVGDPVETPDGSIILPISKVGFGFAAGGSDFRIDKDKDQHPGIGKAQGENANVLLPFGGGSGGGVSITPIAFLVVGMNGVKVVPLDNNTHLYERIIDLAPQVVEKIQSMLSSGKDQPNSMTTAASMGMTTPISTTTPTTTTTTTPDMGRTN